MLLSFGCLTALLLYVACFVGCGFVWLGVLGLFGADVFGDFLFSVLFMFVFVVVGACFGVFVYVSLVCGVAHCLFSECFSRF